MTSINDPAKIDGIKAALISVHFYWVAGEKKYDAGKIQEKFFMSIITARDFLPLLDMDWGHKIIIFIIESAVI